MLTKFRALCPSWETDRNYPFTLPQGSLSCSQVPVIGPYLEAEESILHRSPSEFFLSLYMNLLFLTLILLMLSTLCEYSLKSTRGKGRVFIFIKESRLILSHPQPLNQWLQRVKWPGCEAKHSFPSTTNVSNVWTSTSSLLEHSSS